jgi:putative intracellular protease/amidase
MSANLNRFGTPPRVLIVVANPSVSTTLGWPVGFWASELTHAWYEFTEAGYQTVIASPAGGKVELDALSDPRDASGYSAHDVLSMGFLTTPSLAALLHDTPAIAGLKPGDFDALYIAGGQSPMFTFREHAGLQQLIRAFWDAGKVVCVVCHGTAALLGVKLADGTPLIAGRHMTGFANSEEDFADQVVGQKVMPYRIEDEAKKLGANFVAAPAFRPHAVRDGQLITGQQQYSGRLAALEVIAALGR